MQKQREIWAFPGLGATEAIFDKLQEALQEGLEQRGIAFRAFRLPQPRSRKEPLACYAQGWGEQLAEEAKQVQPIVLGFSLGGIILSYLADYLSPSAYIYVSTLRNTSGRAPYMPLLRILPLHRLVPASFSYKYNAPLSRLLGITDAEGAEHYKRMIAEWPAEQLAWGREIAVQWQGKEPKIAKPSLQIHGKKDHIFPAKRSAADIFIEGGTHYTIRHQAPEIAQHILTFLDSLEPCDGVS